MGKARGITKSTTMYVKIKAGKGAQVRQACPANGVRRQKALAGTWAGGTAQQAGSKAGRWGGAISGGKGWAWGQGWEGGGGVTSGGQGR